MKKIEYIVPEMDVVVLEEADVLTISDNYTPEDTLLGDEE